MNYNFQDANSANSTYFYTKPCNWIDYIPFPAILSKLQIKQNDYFTNTLKKQYDEFLKGEILFVSDTDYTNTYTRIKTSINNYKDRLCPIDPPGPTNGTTMSTLRQLRNVLSPELNLDGSTFKSPRGFDGDSNDLNNEMKEIYKAESLPLQLLMSNYLLVNIRMREARLQLLYLLNYIRGMERNIVNDYYVYKNIKFDFDTKENLPSKDIDWSIPLDKSHETPIDISNLSNHSLLYINGHTLPRYLDSLNCDDNEFTVKDEYGIKIMYEESIKDLEDIENEILKIGSYYILQTNKNRTEEVDKVEVEGRDFVSIDRQTMLMNLYECEVLYYQSKCKLLNQYYYGFLHSCVDEDRLELTHVIFNIMKERPLFDLDENYFSDSYSKEIIAYETHTKVIKEIISDITHNSRSVNNSINRQNQKDIEENNVNSNYNRFVTIGIPTLIVDNNNDSPMINPVSDTPLINPFEIHNNLSQIYRFYKLYLHIFEYMCRYHSITSNSHVCTMKIALLRQCAKDWKNMGTFLIHHYV